MKKLFVIFSFVGSLLATSVLTSCGGCCTGEEAPPPLRPLPSFDGQAQQVHTPVYYAK